MTQRLNCKRVVHVFRRIRGFLAQNAPPVSFGRAGKLVEHFKTVIDRLEAYAR